MDITLNRDALADKLSEVVAIASRKATIPALSGVLLDAQKGHVSFSATDMEISARVACQAKVGAAGRALLPAKRLNDIVRLLPADSSVRISAIDAAVRVECGRYNSRLQTLAAADFPSFPPSAADAQAIHVSGEMLASLIRKVKSAITVTTDVRYFLNGACLLLGPGNRMTLVATDGHRLSVASAARPAGPDAQALISSQALSELTALFEHVDGVVAFTANGNHVRFACSDRALVATTIDGQFPAYERIIPKDNDKSIVVERDEMIEALRRVSLATSDNLRAVTFNVEKSGVRLVGSSSEVGEAVEHVDGKTSKVVEPVSIRLPAQYVLDFLDAAEPGKVAIELRDSMSAAILRQLDESETRYHCVVMPVA